MKSRKVKIIIYVVVGIVVLKLIVAMVSMPKPTVNYVEKYNEITKPIDYDPEQNAVKYYEKASELFHRIPEELRHFTYAVEWLKQECDSLPENIEPEKLGLIGKWLNSNQSAFDKVRIAVQKPYYWVEKSTDNSSILSMTFIELSEIRNISQALQISARYNAIKGNFYQAIDDIILSYQMGHQLSDSQVHTIQSMTGLRIQDKSIKAAFDILSCFTLPPDAVSYFHSSFSSITSLDKISPDLIFEKMMLYDAIQLIYLDWIRGFNRPAFRFIKDFRCMCNKLVPGVWHTPLTGPSRPVLTQKVEHLFDIYDVLSDKTVWEVHHLYKKYVDEIESINKSHFVMRYFSGNYLRIYEEYQKSKVKTEALLTVLAIHMFKQGYDRLPDSLEELVSNEYLKSLPKDPYSEGSLVYRIEGEDFKLYSLGKNFQDNHGEPAAVRYEGPEFSNWEIPTEDPEPELTERTIKWAIYQDDMFWPVFQESSTYDPFRYEEENHLHHSPF